MRFRSGEPPTQAAAISAPAIAALLRAGYAVAATDYAGLGTPGPHHYLSAVAEANAMIDIVRAARAADSRVGAAWASAGHSQGGQAALMAGRLAEAYAPELDFRGTVALAPETTAEHGPALLARPLADPAFAAALRGCMGLPGTGWTHPVRVLHGTADQVVPLPLSVAFTAGLRAGGADIELDVRPGVDHFGIVDAGLPALLANIQTVID